MKTDEGLSLDPRKLIFCEYLAFRWRGATVEKFEIAGLGIKTVEISRE
jgi:hypothetical protein